MLLRWWSPLLPFQKEARKHRKFASTSFQTPILPPSLAITSLLVPVPTSPTAVKQRATAETGSDIHPMHPFSLQLCNPPSFSLCRISRIRCFEFETKREVLGGGPGVAVAADPRSLARSFVPFNRTDVRSSFSVCGMHGALPAKYKRPGKSSPEYPSEAGR